MVDVELYQSQIEYDGNPVPLARPFLRNNTQFEYIYDPLLSGPLQANVVTPLIFKSELANIPITMQITPSDLLAYSEVSTNSNFDAESKWRFIVVQHLNRDFNSFKNVILRKVGSVWKGYFSFSANASEGYWDKRSVLIKAKNGVQLILFPTRFYDGETIVLRP